ncbi:essential protein Yae1, putative [Talaromyces stipitatus ATCC 10500]|uniref:Protein YAE1 n=1 Tax=Talaromyces stipitatus (strain ATCC 10500 / CBS 375.48 / QM 6759 / NRRL 1006) TaxID=441959 RepID=B8MMG6_TALSN|nr:essential protein Yae1, putative [Talaromyces stipitatus ATCC 10500]EED13720.1 essential protein Yae1, putative [Talaromyces stipitatus ATCC 10500]
MPRSPSSFAHSINADAKSAASSSPTTTMTSTPSEAEDTNYNYNNNNSLDDIFGSSPDDQDYGQSQFNDQDYERNRTNDSLVSTQSTTTEPSDLPSLRRQHVTAGYRDGIAFSKSEHVQPGFDAGYPVGAQFGLRVGTILGILEGLVSGLESRSSKRGAVKKRSVGNKQVEEHEETTGREETQKIDKLKDMNKRALKDLDVEALFGGLKAEDVGGGNTKEITGEFTEETKPESRLRVKAEPVVAKWEKLVNITKWEESMEAVESMEDLTAEERRGLWKVCPCRVHAAETLFKSETRDVRRELGIPT